MFEYVEIAIEGTHNRKKIVRLDEVKDLVINKKDSFVSYFVYDKEAIEHFQKNTTMRLFRGRSYAPYLAYDIDAKSIEEACEMTLQLYEDLEKWEISRYFCKTSFSGKKGFHVVISSYLFGGFKPQESLPQKLASLASLLTDIKYDKSTYGNIKLFRAYGSIHGKSGLFKVQVDPDDLKTPSLVLEKAKTFVESWAVHGPDKPISKLVKLKEYAFNLVPEVPLLENIAPKQKLCINKILEGVKTGERHDCIARLTSHFKEIGLTHEMAWASILEWNKHNEEKEVDSGFKETFQSIWNGPYRFYCYDYILDSYCDKKCYLYPRKKGKVKDEEEEQKVVIKSFSEAKKEYEKIIEDDRGIKLGFSHTLDTKIRGHFPGQLGVIVGRPGTYKSTLAQTIGDYYVNNYDGYFLYISLEMSLSMIYERQMQIVSKLNPEEISKSYKTLKVNESYNRYLLSDKTNISAENIKTAVEKFQDISGVKVELLVLDYLHALKDKGGNDRERVGNAMHSLEAMTKDLETRTLVCIHTSREGGGDSYQPLSTSSGRSAAEIEDTAYFYYGLHLIKDDETALCVQLLKNKNGPPWPHGVILDRAPDSVSITERTFNNFLEDV